ncbi:hypothetical protein BHE90_001884 [Fusarium euwallaceae]|uniref:Uncharacterized protein n=1 Tax=Fusarium euwallaceae TaxID=1147111 RepID=A0A430M6S7_9HYPO|nr:hypothetical protein BHE90_001884 [Fusarium euwallaceae]
MDAATTSQRQTLTYKGVHALLLHWQDGSESMYKELSRLRDVLGDTYCYDVKEWQIPRKDSHCELNAYLLRWRKAHGAKGNLLIVYYVGHGIMGKGRESVWLCSDSVDSERVNWTALQVVLTSGTESDVLIIADCCHSGSPGYPSEIRAYGVVELLAACGFESAAPVDGEHYFTHNLVEQLKEDHGRNRKTSQFHTDLQFRLSNYRPSGIEQRVSAILCRLVDVQDDYSIRLAHLPRPADPKRRRVTPLLARQHSTLGSG